MLSLTFCASLIFPKPSRFIHTGENNRIVNNRIKKKSILVESISESIIYQRKKFHSQDPGEEKTGTKGDRQDGQTTHTI